ncbi:MAG: universal stress protein [Ornithinimicrobium sp.]
MRPIMVGLDPAEPCSGALDWALQEAHLRARPLELRLARGLALPAQSDVGLETIMPTSVALAIIERATAYAHDSQPSVHIESQVSSGGAAAVLVHASQDAEAVVVGRQGFGRIAGTLLGSTSAQVSAYAHAPVVVVDTNVAPRPRGRVVVGVDGSRASRTAIKYAFEAAHLRGVELVAVYAWRLNAPEQATLPWISKDALRRLVSEQERVLHEAMAGWAQSFPDVPVRYVLSRRLPVDRLVAEARSAGLLVVGSRGRGGFRGLLLGSVSQGVLHRPRQCPIAIVHDYDSSAGSSSE